MADEKAKEQGNKIYEVIASNNMADAYRLKKDPKSALPYLNRASELAAEIHAIQEQKNSFKGYAATYNDLKDYKNAFQFLTRYSVISDSLFNLKTDSIQSKFEVGLKEKEIDLLTKDQKIKDDELRRQKLVRNAFLVGFALVSALIFILYRDYRNKIKTNKILDSQKAEIESLLLNILPAEVAQELQKTGSATPRFYDSVSVLFTDFKSFTVIADRLSPQEVVAELNDCFRAFDEIIEKYGLEKIKTIGDSYMCAGGIPVAHEGHPERMIHAAMEIRDFVHQMNVDRNARGLDTWEMRIGIHVGPLVAGVVGKKKFAYDIWGSTVNVASRMESNGIPDQINISAATYEMVKDTFDCTYRGKIYAKNVGEIDMYFVNGVVAKS